MNTIDQILQQAPLSVTPDDAALALGKANGDVVKALQILWNISEVKNEETHWERIRNIANEHASEVAKVLKDTKSVNHTGEPFECPQVPTSWK